MPTSRPVNALLKVIVLLAPLVIAGLFLFQAIWQTGQANSAPQVKLENCGAYYIGDPMAKDCPARNQAVTRNAAGQQAAARAGLPMVWVLAGVVSLAALALSFDLYVHWGEFSRSGKIGTNK